MSVVTAVSVPGRAAGCESTSVALFEALTGHGSQTCRHSPTSRGNTPHRGISLGKQKTDIAVRDAQVPHLEANERQTVILLLISSTSRGSSWLEPVPF